jgi:hypothetical protein
MQRINVIRLRVFVQSFGMPVLWLILFLLRFNRIEIPFKTFVSLGLLVSSVFRLLLDETLYLITIEEEGTDIKLTYFNRFMQKRIKVLPLRENGTVSFHKKTWFLDSSTAVTILYEKKTRKFRLLTKEIEQEAKVVLSIRENEEYSVQE